MGTPSHQPPSRCSPPAPAAGKTDRPVPGSPTQVTLHAGPARQALSGCWRMLSVLQDAERGGGASVAGPQSRAGLGLDS